PIRALETVTLRWPLLQRPSKGDGPAAAAWPFILRGSPRDALRRMARASGWRFETRLPPKTKTPLVFQGRFSFAAGTAGSILFEEARKLLLEARDAAAAIHQLGVAAGPGRVRLRVDVEVQRVACLAPGGAGLVLGSVGHHDLNH